MLCVDEKTGIQVLDRTLPLLPLSAKKPRRWTNEYVRHGPQTLLAALEIASDKVVAHVKQRRTSINFLRFLRDVVGAFPERELHMVLDNLNIHKNEAAQRLAATPSRRALPLHTYPCLVGEHGGSFLQHSYQARLGTECSRLETRTERILVRLHCPQ